MTQVADTTNAQEYPTHPEGGPYLFVIAKVEERTSEKGKPLLVFDLGPADEQPGRCILRLFVLNNDESFTLKQICKATGMPTSGGYDSDGFIGKVFGAEVIHKQSGEKLYVNLKPGTLKPSEVKAAVPPTTDNQDDDLPF